MDFAHDQSFGFSVMSSNKQTKPDDNISNSREISPSSSQDSLINRLPIKSSYSSESIFSTLLAISNSSNMSNVHDRIDEIKNIQQLVPEPNNAKGAASTMDNMNLFDILSAKRSYPSSDSSVSTTKPKASKRLRDKTVNSSVSTSIEKDNFKSNKDYRTTTIGSLTLAWPPYQINNTSFRGQNFSVVNTCPVDTGLFVFYHAYKAGTDKFRHLFEFTDLKELKLLHRVFHLVENEDWTMARLFWLTENNLLKHQFKNGQYDIKNTMDEIVFRFVKPLQTYPLKSKCTCSACPKIIRVKMSEEIRLG